jgi:hypothetical protein
MSERASQSERCPKTGAPWHVYEMRDGKLRCVDCGNSRQYDDWNRGWHDR